jgi:hypothetical protein
MSCQFRDAFGAPGTGAHSIRFLDTAIFDYVLTIIGAMVLTKVTGIPLVLTTIGLLVLGIVLHMLVCLRTGTEVWLFGK